MLTGSQSDSRLPVKSWGIFFCLASFPLPEPQFLHQEEETSTVKDLFYFIVSKNTLGTR